MKENIPFPTPSREVDFLGINLIIMQALYGEIINVHLWLQNETYINGETEETLFLNRKLTKILPLLNLFPFHF